MFYPESIKLHGPQEEMSVLFRHFQGALLQCESLLKSLKPFAITELENRLLTGNGCGESENDPISSPIAGMLFFLEIYYLILPNFSSENSGESDYFNWRRSDRYNPLCFHPRRSTSSGTRIFER